MKLLRRAGTLILIMVCLFIFVSCKSSVKSYAVGTDFGGDIAIVATYDGEGELGKLTGSYDPKYKYFCIDKSGERLFSLPEKLIPAYDDFAIAEMAPVNNYIFATDFDDKYACKYVLDKNGTMILSPEKCDYDAIIVPQNYREMFYDGYLLVYKNSFTYNTSEQLLSCFDLHGNQLFEYQKLFNYDINERFAMSYYAGNGIISLGDECLNLKTGVVAKDSDIESLIYNSENYDFALQDSEINRRAASESVDEDSGWIYSIYNGYFGIGFYNEDNHKDYVSVAKIDEGLLFEPFPTDEFKKVCVHDKGFIIVPDKNTYQTECDIMFYDFNGKLVKTVQLKELPKGILEINDFSCGFFKIEASGELYNYMDSNGVLLF